MNVLLTGAGGFIGSSILPCLIRAGHDVTVLTRPDSMEAIRQRLHVEDLTCRFQTAGPSQWAEAVGSQSYDACLHLAWIATPGIYLTSSENETFADATLALAERLFRNGTAHFIGTGTCIEYAPGQTGPCQEINTPVEPTSPYGLAKQRTQMGLEQLAGELGTHWTWARIFYPYGLGEHPARTVSTFLRTLAAGQPLNLKTGASIKDFIEIQDLSAALVHLTGIAPQGLINLGTGVPVSIMDLAHAAARLTGADPALVKNSGEGQDPYAYHLSDSRKLQSTGWSPSITLEEGMIRLRNSLISNQS